MTEYTITVGYTDDGVRHSIELRLQAPSARAARTGVRIRFALQYPRRTIRHLRVQQGGTDLLLAASLL